ncbi:MAG: hypothetical protein AAF471_02840 [Myxococcota bacterium]
MFLIFLSSFLLSLHEKNKGTGLGIPFASFCPASVSSLHPTNQRYRHLDADLDSRFRGNDKVEMGMTKWRRE